MSFITISKENFFHNLEYLTNKLGSKDKLSVVLKDNAYGHGAKLMAKLSQEFGIKRAVVKNETEADEIEEFFKEIILLNPNFTHQNKKYHLVINSLQKLKLASKNQNIHLKVDSGMHRNGLSLEELEDAFKMLLEKKLNLTGVLTHFRSADELSSELFWQSKNWKNIKSEVKKLCKKYNIPIPLFHSGNSATVLRLENYEDDFARCGIAIYGYHEMQKSFGEFELKPVLKLFGEKISTRELKKGSRIGYGGVGVLKEDSLVSTYDIGYADGFTRNLYPNIVGRVSMDSVSVLGNSQNICLISDAKELAKQNNTISYEILVKLHPNIRRIVE